jgi:flagellar motor switch protein FliN/FliY
MAEADAPAGGQPPAEYIQLWAEQAAQVMGQISGAAVPCTALAAEPAGLAAAGEPDVWALVTSSGGLRGEMSLRVPPAAVLRLAQTFMSEPVNPEAELTGDHKDALIELLRQVAGLVSTAAKKRWGEIQLHVEMAAAPPSWPAAETFWLQIGEDGPAAMALQAGLSAALVAEVRAEKAEKAEAAKAEAAKAEAGLSSPPPPAAPPADSGAPTGAMDLLMDVQLAVTMRFGARRLLLREVLELSPGAVVELDRKVQEPVELLLDGRLIARGEVVVIDGNYGLRVTDTSPLGLAVGAGHGQ